MHDTDSPQTAEELSAENDPTKVWHKIIKLAEKHVIDAFINEIITLYFYSIIDYKIYDIINLQRNNTYWNYIIII